VQSHDSERTHADGGPNGSYAPQVPQVPERTPDSRPHRKPSPLRPQARNASFRVHTMRLCTRHVGCCHVANALCPLPPRCCSDIGMGALEATRAFHVRPLPARTANFE